MIVRAGTTMTILDLVGSVSRVLRRRVPVVMSESPESSVQPQVLRFRERRGVQATHPDHLVRGRHQVDGGYLVRVITRRSRQTARAVRW